MSKRKRTSCLNNIINILFTGILVLATAWGLQFYSSANGSVLKFAQISDVHLSSDSINKAYRLTAHSTELLDDAINYVNTTPNIDFVAFTGDVIDKPLQVELNRFIKHASNLTMPYYTVPGNHDICLGGYLSKRLYVDVFKEANPNYNSDKTYYAITPKEGYRAIFLDSIIDTRLTAQGEISKEELQWLDEELMNATGQVVLIFSHVPIKEPFSSNSHKLTNADEVLSILKKYKNPIAVFSGHYHTTRVFKEENIIHVSTPALISYPNAFRIITINNMKHKTVFNIEYVPTRLSELQKKSKLLVFHASRYYGDASDRTVTLTIEKR